MGIKHVVRGTGEVSRGTPDPILPVGVELVLGAVVGAGVGVARAAGLHGVAAHLHVPEQRLAQHHRLQPGRLLPRHKAGVVSSSAGGEEPDEVVLIGNLQVRASRIGARAAYGERRIPEVIGGRSSSADFGFSQRRLAQASNAKGDIERLDHSAARRIREQEPAGRIEYDTGTRSEWGCSVGYLHGHTEDIVRCWNSRCRIPSGGRWG